MTTTRVIYSETLDSSWFKYEKQKISTSPTSCDIPIKRNHMSTENPLYMGPTIYLTIDGSFWEIPMFGHVQKVCTSIYCSM